MIEAEAAGMQCLSMKSDPVSPSVDRVAHQRMLERREVDAYLVSTARLEPAAEKRTFCETRAHFVMRDGSLACRYHCHRGALDRVSSNRRIDVSAASEHAVNERDVLAPHRSRLKLSHELALSGLGLSDHQEPASVF